MFSVRIASLSFLSVMVFALGCDLVNSPEARDALETGRDVIETVQESKRAEPPALTPQAQESKNLEPPALAPQVRKLKGTREDEIAPREPELNDFHEKIGLIVGEIIQPLERQIREDPRTDTTVIEMERVFQALFNEIEATERALDEEFDRLGRENDLSYRGSDSERDSKIHELEEEQVMLQRELDTLYRWKDDTLRKLYEQQDHLYDEFKKNKLEARRDGVQEKWSALVEEAARTIETVMVKSQTEFTRLKDRIEEIYETKIRPREKRIYELEEQLAKLYGKAKLLAGDPEFAFGWFRPVEDEGKAGFFPLRGSVLGSEPSQTESAPALEAGLPPALTAETTDWIVYVAEVRGNRHVFRMRPDGSGVTQITTGESQNLFPTRSPDKSRIAFMRQTTPEGEDRYGDIYVINSDGTGLRRLTVGGDYHYPDWSPTGDVIIFDGYGSGIQTIHSTGGDVRTVLSDGLADRPDWSPDGGQVAFHRAGEPGVRVMNADGSDVKLVSIGFYPDWSPDGSKILFHSESDGDWDIYSVNVDGTGLVNLTADRPGADVFPDWSQDGEKIVFTFWEEGARNSEIGIMDAEGGPVTNITNSPHDESFPQW